METMNYITVLSFEMGKVYQYHFAKCQGPNSIEKSIHESIESIFEREELLLQIKR